VEENARGSSVNCRSPIHSTCGCCGPHGRPTVLESPRDLFFSLSHRGDLALIGAALAPIRADADLIPDQLEAADEA
jgi:4'-phosphopantetheinyl transferase